MRVRVLPAGDAALLIDVEVAGDERSDTDGRSWTDDVLALNAAMREAALDGVVDLVPAARTVLVVGSVGIDLAALRREIAAIADRTIVDGTAATGLDDDVLIPVRYDGPDLDDVARLTGLTRAEVIAKHTGTRWRAAFIGFAPGFAYLAAEVSGLAGSGLDVPRRAESRTSVPAGSVALAAGYSAVYPNASPGGWQLIGSTDALMWNVDRDPPALIGLGQWVRFAAASPNELGGGGEIAGGATDAAAPVTAGALQVVRTGPLSLFQDLGRNALASVGVGFSGAADRSSYLAANRLLGNHDNAAAIECVLGGLVLRAAVDVRVAVTGAALPVAVDGESVQSARPIDLAAGQVLKLGTPKVGLRSYLAVLGGFDVPAVLGSRSTDTLSGLGPKPLQRGDLLRVEAVTEVVKVVATQQERVAVSDPGVVTLRAVLGPRDDWFAAPAELAVGEWVVSPNSNRVGIRLDRPPCRPAPDAPALRRRDSRELPSEGLALGSVQVPPSGQPVLFLADHPVTGGYPVIAVVVQEDIDLAAQVRPGQWVRFHLTGLADPSAGYGR